MAVFQSINPSFSISIAKRTAARPVRLPLRVWSMNNLPSWIVNSKSWTSLKCASSVLRTFSSAANASGRCFLSSETGSGVRTPEPVSELKKHLPEAFAALEKVRKTLEAHFKDVQDFEFTIQDGKLFMLQTRNGKRTGLAAVRFAIEMEKEGLIDWKTAVRRVPADQLDQVLAPIFDRQAIKDAKCIARGLPAGPGAASGQMYFNADRAVDAAAKGEKVLLVRNETSPEDLRGMIAAEGILTARGGVSSHAALVARQMGKVCVCGASELQIDY